MPINVSDWLNDLWLDQYAAAFRDNDIDGDISMRSAAPSRVSRSAAGNLVTVGAVVLLSGISHRQGGRP